MHPLDLATLASFHAQYAQAPEPAQQAGWHHAHEQQQRFAQLVKIAPLAGHTVLDAGCGPADLWAYLKELPGGAPAYYWGVDVLPRFIAQARQRWVQDPRVSVAVGDVAMHKLPVADYVLASGSLSYPSKDAQHPFSTLEHLWQHARRGLGFNMLKALPEPTDGSAINSGFLCRYAPKQIVAFCKSLSPKVRLLQNYSPIDFTVFVYKV